MLGAAEQFAEEGGSAAAGGTEMPGRRSEAARASVSRVKHQRPHEPKTYGRNSCLRSDPIRGLTSHFILVSYFLFNLSVKSASVRVLQHDTSHITLDIILTSQGITCHSINQYDVFKCFTFSPLVD